MPETSSVARRAVKILLNTMPKSGSVYILKSLAINTGLKTMHLGDPSNGKIGIEDILAFCGGGYVAQNHLASSAENLQILQQFKPKMILHLRDPRQALLSWVYHVDWKNKTEGLIVPGQPRYFESSLSSKIDWQIESHLVDLIVWLKRWVEIADEGTLPVLITEQDNLRRNERAFFEEILDYYQVRGSFELPQLPRTLETHFRKADPDEWRRTFTPEQAARATAAIPDALRRRFGWID